MTSRSEASSWNDWADQMHWVRNACRLSCWAGRRDASLAAISPRRHCACGAAARFGRGVESSNRHSLKTSTTFKVEVPGTEAGMNRAYRKWRTIRSEGVVRSGRDVVSEKIQVQKWQENKFDRCCQGVPSLCNGLKHDARTQVFV